MNNPILEHRQMVQERILKGFESDELEKGQFKYTEIVTTKSGKKRYVYPPDVRGLKKVKGKSIKVDDDMEITNHQNVMYDDIKKNDLKKKILALDGVSGFKISGKNSQYYKFKKDGANFKIRIAGHTRSSEDNEVLFPIFYHSVDRAWFIDVNLGDYKPKTAALIVDNITKKLSKYDNDDTVSKLKKYANEHDIKPNLKDDEFDVYNKAYELASKYIEDNELEDDEYRTTYQVLRYVGATALNEIAEDMEEKEVEKALL